MAGHVIRVTNGHRAAVCGLMIAGLTLKDAAAVVGVPRQRVRAFIPHEFFRQRPIIKWHGELLRDLEEAYFNRTLTATAIHKLFGITPANLCKIANRHGWPKRRLLRKPPPRVVLQRVRARAALVASTARH